EQSISDCLKDTFPDFEHLHFGDDTETAYIGDKPETGAAMEDNNNQDEDSVSWTVSRVDLVKTQGFTNTDVEVETSSRNSKDGLLDKQSMKTGPIVYGSWDHYDSDEEKTQSKNQQLSLHEEKLKEDELETHAETSDIHRMIKEQARVQMEDVGFLEKDPGMVMTEKTSHLLSFQMVDNLEEKSSASEEEITDPEDIEEHAFQHAQVNKERNNFIEDDPMMSIDVQPRDDIKEFTEDDPVRVEEGLADYPSDLSQSEDEDCPEGEPSHMNSELDEMHLQADEEHCFYQLENQAITSTDDDSKRKNKSMNPAHTATYIKSDLDVEDVCEEYNSNAEKGNSGIENTVESADSENFPSIALLYESSKGDTNEQRDYDSDISSDEDYMRKSIASHEQENTFAKEVVECEEDDMEDTDSQNVEICDVGGLSGVLAFPEAGMLDPSAYGSRASDNSNISVSHLESNSVKPDEDNTEHNNDFLNTGESHNTLFPETFWRLVDEDSLKLDEYDWDVNEEEVICDEEEDFLEELENEEEMERDWEKERERIEAFNRYYKSFEGEEIVCRSHKVTFRLDPESTRYEEECSSSEDELSTNVSELHAAEPVSVDLHQSNKEHNSKPLEALDAGENIHNVQPETLWSTTLLMDEGNVELNEYDHDIHREDLGKLNSSEVFCDEKKHFTGEQKNDGQEVKRERHEQARTEVLNRGNKEHENEVPDLSHNFLFVNQESSQTEDNESSEQESNTEDDNRKTKVTPSDQQCWDQSDSDEPQSCTQLLSPGRQKLPKHSQKLNKNQKEPKSKCLVLLKSVLAVSLATAVGVLSYWWATDSLDWIY
ncbi:putative tanabin, partial [Triplophysa rosa]